jgi:hypothetical protein
LVGDDVDRKAIEEKLERKKKRLELYYEKEAEMLSPKSVQSYGIGSRNASRYQLDLKNLRAQIKELEDEVDELQGMLSNNKPRRAVAIVPHDW